MDKRKTGTHGKRGEERGIGKEWKRKKEMSKFSNKLRYTNKHKCNRRIRRKRHENMRAAHETNMSQT